MQLGEAEHALAALAEVQVDLLELLFPLGVDDLRAVLDQKARTELPDLLRRALDKDAVVRVVLRVIDYAQRVLVRRVERHLRQLPVSQHHDFVAIARRLQVLHRLEELYQARLRRVAV